MAIVKAIHFSVLFATYGLALAFYPAISHGLDVHPYFPATYLGAIGASAVLSLLAMLSRPGMWLYAILAVRVYLLVVLGYSIEAFLSARLVLGIGLMTEIGFLVDFPWALAPGRPRGCGPGPRPGRALYPRVQHPRRGASPPDTRSGWPSCKVIHLSVLVATYGLALAFFPAISPGLSTHPYFSETYLGSIAASAVLSVLALLSGPACGSTSSWW